MLNIVALTGRLVADPELRQTNNGKSIANLRVACDRGRKDANGNTVADFFKVVAWERTAEFACKYFQKGSAIAVDGRLQSQQYKDKDGNNRSAIVIVANNLNFCGSKRDSEQACSEPSGASQNTQTPAYAAGSNDDFALIEDSGDLPF